MKFSKNFANYIKSLIQIIQKREKYYVINEEFEAIKLLDFYWDSLSKDEKIYLRLINFDKLAKYKKYKI